MEHPTDPLAGVIPARTVNPRQRGYVHIPLVVAHESTRIDTDTGEILPDYFLLTEQEETVRDIPLFVKHTVPSIFVITDPSRFLSLLEETYPKTLGYTLARPEREVGDLTISRVKLQSFIIRPTEGKVCCKRHCCWNPRTMSPSPYHKFIIDPTHHGLMVWATDVRTWARENDLQLRGAFASYASQLLRDPRFYPEPRRRVPRATNEKARPSLPGNLTTLYVSPGSTEYDVQNIDQNRTHHKIAQEIDLPSANTLFARGRFGDLDNVFEYWAKRGDNQYQYLTSRPGLLYVDMHSRPTTKQAPFRLPIQDYTGRERRFIYTNQIAYMESHGSYIEGIYAAWIGDTCDKGLAQYGKYAENELDHADIYRKLWLKPLLHTSYGLLAARPRTIQIGHRQSSSGKPTQFLIGTRAFDVNMITLKDYQPAIVNLIQRGMIEAETQIRSLTMAEQLTEAGCRILHIHTDGIHVQGQLPILPDTWTVEPLTHVIYRDPVSWVAAERACLPGRDAKQREEEIQHHANLHSIIANKRNERRHDRSTQRTQERSLMAESGNGKHQHTIDTTTSSGEMANRTQPITYKRQNQLDGVITLPVRSRGKRSTRTAKRAKLPGVKPTALDTLTERIPWGAYGKLGGLVSTIEDRPEGVIPLPSRGRNGASDDALAKFHALVVENRIADGDGYVVAEGVKKETTARNRARAFGKRYEDKYGVKLAAHAVPGNDDMYRAAVSVRIMDDDTNTKRLAELREQYKAEQDQIAADAADTDSGNTDSDSADNTDASAESEPSSGADAAAAKRTKKTGK